MRYLFLTLTFLLFSITNADWKQISKSEASKQKPDLLLINEIPKNCLIEGEYYEFSGRVTHIKSKNRGIIFIDEHDSNKWLCLFVKENEKFKRAKTVVAARLLNANISRNYEKAIFKGTLSVRKKDDDIYGMDLNVINWELPK